MANAQQQTLARPVGPEDDGFWPGLDAQGYGIEQGPAVSV